jgi:hypothetical protein
VGKMEDEYQTLCEIFKIIGSTENAYEPFFFTNDYPVPYKNIMIYPIKVSLYQVFHICVETLILDEEHRQGGDKYAIPLTYLNYLLYKAEVKKVNVFFQLKTLLKMCLHLDEYFVSADGENIESINFFKNDKGKLLIRINNDIYDSKDFDIIRKIICEQNCVEMPDLNIPPDLKKKYREQDDYYRKLNENKMCNFDELKSRVTGRTGIIKQDINKMSIREFTQLVESLDMITSYDTQILLTPDMKKEDAKKIKHWLCSAKAKDRYAKYRTDITAYSKENKIDIIKK